MPDLSPEKERQRRRNAAAKLAAGGLMIGGATAAQEHLADKTGVKSGFAAAKDVLRTRKISGAHGRYGAGWLATRGVAAAGVPLAAVGAKNLVAPKPKHVGGLHVGRDVVVPSIDRTAVGLPNIHKKPPVSRRAQAAQGATVGTGATLGGLAGTALARRVPKGRLRLAAIGTGAALGTASGAAASTPLGRKAVRRSTHGEYDYTAERGVYRRPVRKAATLPQQEQKEQIHRKHKAANLGMASAGIGVTALGLRAPAAVKYAAKKIPSFGKLKPVQRVASWEAKATPASWNVGVLGTGVGSAAALNAARMQRADLRAEEGKIKKRLLVTGSRDWDDESAVHGHLDRIAAEHPDMEIIEGGARGADTHARTWAKKRKRKVTTYQADWKTHGRAAGPRRNQRMIDEGKPDRVLAFSRDLTNSKGTKDMVRRARKAGLRVDVVDKRAGERAPSKRDHRWSERNESWRDHVSDKAKSAYDSGRLTPEQMSKIRARGHQRGRMSGSTRKQHNGDLAKALVPSGSFRIRPPKFGGIKPGGIRTVQTPTGLKQIRYRGSLG